MPGRPLQWVFSPPRWFPRTAHLTLKVEPKKEVRRDWAEAAVWGVAVAPGRSRQAPLHWGQVLVHLVHSRQGRLAVGDRRRSPTGDQPSKTMNLPGDRERPLPCLWASVSLVAKWRDWHPPEAAEIGVRILGEERRPFSVRPLDRISGSQSLGPVWGKLIGRAPSLPHTCKLLATIQLVSKSSPSSPSGLVSCSATLWAGEALGSPCSLAPRP